MTPLLIRRYREAEVDAAIKDAEQRGYILSSRGKERHEYVASAKIVYWAKLVHGGLEGEGVLQKSMD